MSISTKNTPDLSKLEPLNGTNYRRWSQKLLMFFEQLDIDYVLFNEAPNPCDTTTDDEATPPVTSSVKSNEETIKKFDKDNKTARFHMLNHMSNTLFDLFMIHKSAKVIWENLHKKYGADDAGKKKYVVGKWLAFQMNSSLPIMEQVHIYENLCADVINEGMKLCDVFLANVLLEKFPPTWTDYRNYLKHKKKDLTLEELVSHMRTEEANRLKDKPVSLPNSVKVNLVESGGSSMYEKSSGHGRGFVRGRGFGRGRGRGRSQSRGSETGHGSGSAKSIKPVPKIQKPFTLTCYVCGKSGHKAYQCPQKKTAESNLVETDEIISAVVVEANLVGNVADWVLDTGASRHLCADKGVFADFEEVAAGECVYMGNSSSAEIKGKGKILLKLTSGKTLALKNTLYVPSLRRNLVSGALLNKAGLRLVFEADKVVMSRNGEFVGKGYLCGGLFILNTEPISAFNSVASTSVSAGVSEINKMSTSAYIAESIDVWHGRLGHVNVNSIKKLRNLSLIPSLTSKEFEKCPSCVEAKFVKKPSRTVKTRETSLLELIHTDLAVFRNTVSRGGKHYYITFIDDYSRYARVYLLRNKDEAEQSFINFKFEVENQLDRKIKRIRSDRGGEYGSNTLIDFCEKNGIIHETTPPYSPQSNGVAERKNRTLKEMMNAMLLSSGLSDEMWGEAVLSACHILNRVPHKNIDSTPYEMWKGYPPNLSLLKVWGCLAKVGLPDFRRPTVGPRTYDCVFIGYAENSSAYRFMSLSDRSLSEAANAEFFEHVFPLKKVDVSFPSIPVETDLSVDDLSHASGSTSIVPVVEPRRSKRPRHEKNLGDDFVTFLSEHASTVCASDEFVSAYLIEDDPKTFSEAMRSIDANFWRDAIKNELDSIVSNQTWELTDLPKGCKPISCKWIFKKKMRPDGTIERFKARLVVRGFTQKKDIDYFDTYSPVTKISTIRTLIAIAAIHGLVVHQMDVKTAFLNGELREEIYMAQPEGFVIEGQESKVCKLRKSLYGLKQAPKQWYEKFNNTLITNGYVVNNSDSCVYSKMIESDCVIICLYVDDMLIFGSNLNVVIKTKEFLSSQFEMKDLGEANVILGVKVMRTSNGISLSQAHYVEKVLKKFNCFDVTPARTPYDPNLHLSKNLGKSVSQEEYAKVLGSVMFLMNCTRPDIAYAVSRLSRYTHNPSSEHWIAITRLLKYLKGTVDLCLHYSKFPAVLEGYCDANWISGNDETYSTSGYVFTLGGGAVSWKSSKQTCIAQSTMESEFIALALAGEEAEWLKNLLADVPVWGGRQTPVSLHCDSQAAITNAKNSVYNAKKRHMRIRHAAVRQLLENGVIAIDYVKSESNLADPFTKGLTRKLVSETARGMGLRTLGHN